MILLLALATALASLAIVGGLLARHGPVVADRLAGAGKGVVGFTVLSFLLLLGVQTFRTEAVETFPYASWTMYGHPEPLTGSWRLEAERASGAVGPLEPRLIMKEPNPRIIGFWVVRWGHALETGDPAAVHEAEAGLERLARSLAALDARRNPGDPVTGVHLEHCALPVEGGRVTAWRLDCTRLRSWELAR